MELKPYKKYKPSGIEWIGEIPKHWEVKRLGSFGRFSKGGGISRAELTEDGLPAILYGDIYTKYNTWVKDVHNKISDETAKSAKRIYKNFLLFTGSGETMEDIGKCVVYLNDKPAFAGGDVIVFEQSESDSLFLSYTLNTEGTKFEKAGFSRGEIIVHISSSKLKEIKIPIPPKEEQIKIKNFLTDKTSLIDKLIADKQKLIELLKEEKAALINQAVTKGINPKANMKQSGIEFLGEIPEHWEVKKLKYVVEGKLEYGANEAAELSDHSLPRYIRITDFGDNGKLRDDTFKSLPKEVAKDYLLLNGDILFARSGATVGKTFQFKNYKGEACFAGYLIRARPKLIESDFLFYFTKSRAYENWRDSIFNQATIQNIGADKYNVLEVPIPPKEEQKLLIEFIKSNSSKIDQAISQTEKEITLLQEYRTALISEVVTGKVDVRGL